MANADGESKRPPSGFVPGASWESGEKLFGLMLGRVGGNADGIGFRRRRLWRVMAVVLGLVVGVIVGVLAVEFPAAGAVMQPLATRVTIHLSDTIDSSSVTANSFVVRPLGGAPVAGNYSMTSINSISFGAVDPLLPNTEAHGLPVRPVVGPRSRGIRD